MFDPYTPADWYWRVVDIGRIYSSRARAYVDTAVEGRTTTINTEAELVDVLLAQSPQSLPSTAPQRQAWLREQIRLEAERRIMRAIDARNLDHSGEAQRTAALVAANILNKKQAGQALLPEERAAEVLYSFLFPFIAAVKLAQRQLEEELNETYADDRNWPGPTSP